MTTSADLERILQQADKETLTVELKESAILESEGKKKLACELVALGNRHGGKLIIGVTDKGGLEGKGIFGDLDRKKEVIDDICYIQISPPLEYSLEFLECEGGDVLIIEVRRRRGMPHAFIASRGSSEIKNRVYYIRTEYGKRLVTDTQLRWLFQHQGDPSLSFPFSVVINILRDGFGVPGLFPQPTATRGYVGFLNGLNEEERKRMQDDPGKAARFLLEVTPYVLLQRFFWVFGHSWSVSVRRHGSRTSWGAKRKDLPTERITAERIPLAPEDWFLASSSCDMRDILRRSGPVEFCLPANSNVSVQQGESKFSVQLCIENPDFRVVIRFNLATWGCGLNSRHPLAGASFLTSLSEPGNVHRDFTDSFYSVDLDACLEASFSFPDRDVELFEEYEKFVQTIKDILECEWDFDRFVSNLPDPVIYAIQEKVDRMANVLSERSDAENKG